MVLLPRKTGSRTLAWPKKVLRQTKWCFLRDMTGRALTSSSLKVRAAAKHLLSHLFTYRRVGHDQRLMSFLEDGRIGRGARSCEASWSLRELKGCVVLEIASESDITCRLRKAEDAWRGRWLQNERMPIELVPIQKFGTASQVAAGQCILPPSLFIISLPRSLSTVVYHAARRAVGLSEPSWTSAGEVLNMDRICFNGGGDDVSVKFIQHTAEPKLFFAATEFMDQLVGPHGFAYKDVIQPFVISHWLSRREFNVIRLKRDIADVAFAMLNRNWHYPAKLHSQTENLGFAMVYGLVLAEKALESVPAEQIEFDQLIVDEMPLNRALRNLYGKGVQRVKLLSEEFKTMRSRVLARRKSKKFGILQDYVAQARSEAISKCINVQKI